jgi:hypothetical protein
MVQVVEASPAAQELEEIMELRLSTEPNLPVTPLLPRVDLRPRRQWLVAVVSAAAVLVLVGGAALLLRVTGSDSPVADSVVPTTVTESTPEPAPTTGTWSRVPQDEAVFGGDGEQKMFGVTVGGPGLVAVGSAVWTSPDGITWSRVPYNEAVFGGGAEMSSVTVGGPGLVAVGHDHDGDAVVWTSPDGVSWTRVFHDEAVFGGATMRSVTVGGPGLVAVGSDGGGQSESSNAVVWTSPDGIDWSRVPHNEAVFGGPAYRVGVAGAHVGMRSVTVGGPGLVAVGWDWPHAAVWTSPDGITWSRVSHDKALQSASCWPPSGSCFDGAVGLGMSSVTVGGPGLVAVGDAGHPDSENGVVWTSVDGITWSRVPYNEAVFGGGAEMSSVTVGGPGLVAVGDAGHPDGENGVVWTSVDGITWSRVPHNDAVFGGAQLGMSSVIVGGPGLVAVGAADTDAAVWTTTAED